ncbi:MAG: Na+/H+ antiporter subunit E [Dysgonamonadaceae bacterium]|jgi:multisubunit Na+/H+ antiporter MnhE subunit|nr:Na+/H+ antiporter subunit E [Dysgonamonadaceae bacterium]MDD3356053.1 Na+/H+ antiporter subunit E [Dysgonamonadaceae bacterium]MDD3728285.1 Na+/H+ antiporter subunit E [Dysgonamonadaceae bacterium]MDD4246453.1 Na+/H+ antiporter subunit E [Dysgonamonadaceae bacterium]MDD4605320.1 Na+/H+ antiporter subunit E [Dysgonamonadaceae bacterium]
MKLILKPYYIVAFLLFYLYKLVEANLIIAHDILTPNLRINPGFIKVPLTLNSNFGMLLFSNLVSMTPGSLSIDITDDKKTMLVHVLYQTTEDEMLKEFEDMQDKIKRITE